MALPDPTFDNIALKDLRAKGVTCRSCEHWIYVGRGDRSARSARSVNGTDGMCEISRPSFPRVCRLYQYMPGSDELIDQEEDTSR